MVTVVAVLLHGGETAVGPLNPNLPASDAKM
jgi:hypothetical protein